MTRLIRWFITGWQRAEFDFAHFDVYSKLRSEGHSHRQAIAALDRMWKAHQNT